MPRRARLRIWPPMVSAVSTKTESDVPPTRARTPRREMVGGARRDGDQHAVHALRSRPADTGTQLGSERTGSQGMDMSPIDRDVHNEPGHERPGPVEVSRVERDPAVVVDIEDPRAHLEHDAPDDEYHANPLEQLGDRGPRRPYRTVWGRPTTTSPKPRERASTRASRGRPRSPGKPKAAPSPGERVTPENRDRDWVPLRVKSRVVCRIGHRAGHELDGNSD